MKGGNMDESKLRDLAEAVVNSWVAWCESDCWDNEQHDQLSGAATALELYLKKTKRDKGAKKGAVMKTLRERLKEYSEILEESPHASWFTIETAIRRFLAETAAEDATNKRNAKIVKELEFWVRWFNWEQPASDEIKWWSSHLKELLRDGKTDKPPTNDTPGPGGVTFVCANYGRGEK